MNINEFQKDLQFMSLEDALIKHNTNLREVWYELHYQKTHKHREKPRTKPHRSTGYRYISENQKSFLLRKNHEYYGRYDTIEEALFIRDYLEEYGWNKSNLEKARSQL